MGTSRSSRVHEALNGGDIDALLAVCDQDFRLDMRIESSTRPSTRGTTESDSSTPRFRDVWGVYVWEPEQLIEAGPDVVALLRSTGRGRGSGVEVERPSGLEPPRG